MDGAVSDACEMLKTLFRRAFASGMYESILPQLRPSTTTRWWLYISLCSAILFEIKAPMFG